jgi:hypothetical protein
MAPAKVADKLTSPLAAIEISLVGQPVSSARDRIKSYTIHWQRGNATCSE